jgi:hypothetical protein
MNRPDLHLRKPRNFPKLFPTAVMNSFFSSAAAFSVKVNAVMFRGSNQRF